jgi:5-methylcytosine-specific restriction endonuclease McrA
VGVADGRQRKRFTVIPLLELKVLVLNQSYEPLGIISARKAAVLLIRGRAHLVEETGLAIRTVSRAFPLPSVVRLSVYVRTPRRKIALSKRNVMRRDGHMCQYCGAQGVPMTIDHIVPRSWGGLDAWENLVCACRACNARKGDRPPEHAGLPLRRRPKHPDPFMFLHMTNGLPDESWGPYLFRR